MLTIHGKIDPLREEWLEVGHANFFILAGADAAGDQGCNPSERRTSMGCDRELRNLQADVLEATYTRQN